METEKVEVNLKCKIKWILGWIYFLMMCGLIAVFVILPNRVLPILYSLNETIGIQKLSESILESSSDLISMNVDASFLALFFDFLILFIVTYIFILFFKRMKWLKILLLWVGFAFMLFYSYSMPLNEYYHAGDEVNVTVGELEEKTVVQDFGVNLYVFILKPLGCP